MEHLPAPPPLPSLRSDHMNYFITFFRLLKFIPTRCYRKDSVMCFLFAQNSNNPSYRRIYEHMERRKSFVSSMDEGVQRAKEGNYAFIGESVSLDLAVARHCELVRAHEVIGMRGYSIVTPLGETNIFMQF